MEATGKLIVLKSKAVLVSYVC